MLRRGSAGTHRTLGLQKVFKTFEYGEVAERSIAAGCKPAAFGLRRFEPSPPHQPSPRRSKTRLRLAGQPDAKAGFGCKLAMAGGSRYGAPAGLPAEARIGEVGEREGGACRAV